jgi:hypothetical protein
VGGYDHYQWGYSHQNLRSPVGGSPTTGGGEKPHYFLYIGDTEFGASQASISSTPFETCSRTGTTPVAGRVCEPAIAGLTTIDIIIGNRIEAAMGMTDEQDARNNQSERKSSCRLSKLKF